MRKYNHQIGVGGLVISEQEKKLVLEVLDSNRLTYGDKSKEFERSFSRQHQCDFGLYLNSGTSALQVALAALKEKYHWSDGDEILVPAITFVATSNIVLQNNLIPIFVDVEPSTYNLDPKKIEEKISPRTRAIIPVHLLGLPASMQPIMEIAEKYDLAVIEDSAECMFARYKGQSVGSFGDIGCFSTYAAHILVTGVGGLATTNDRELALLMRSLMNHGRDNIYISCSDDAGLEGAKLKEVIERRFSFERVGFSYRCTEMEAALGLGQMARAQELLARRQKIATLFTQELSDISSSMQLPTCPPDRTHSYMMYGIVAEDHKSELVNYLENLNIETRDLMPLLSQPIYKKMFGAQIEDHFPVARWVNRHGFYIGCHPYLTDDEIGFMIEAIRSFFKRAVKKPRKSTLREIVERNVL